MSSSGKKLTDDPEYLQSLSWLSGMTAISHYIGQGEFDQTLFSFLNEFLLIDHFAVFTYSKEEGAGHLFTKSIMPEEEAEELARDYVDEYHQRDPHFSQGNSLKGNEDEEPVHPRLDAEYDPEYRDHFFTQHDLVDKISITRKVEDGHVYCNFYRIGESGQFTSEERQLFDTFLPLITNLIASHFTILMLQGKNNPDEIRTAKSLVHSVISRKVTPFDKLTSRESDVCERILLGLTSTGISLDLNIAESSVNTYRRRAYEKLNIATQNELFSLCISALDRIKR
ncbi:MAG: DNA-binding CsgD family transcriptional regulator [Gammaproteobacteria bacterium]|jgi:DNA-binding CsgD family transcriptional regulator